MAGGNDRSGQPAGLRYALDDRPGISRRRAGKGFSYRDAEGRPLRDAATLARIRALAIPPAWTAVWISPDPRGHLQATGRDARGRKQYRYHPRWRAVRDADKFRHVIAFARLLPRIRRRVSRDLKRPGLPRDKVLAAVVRLLDTTLLRVGNEEYARENGSYGLTTLRDRHVDVSGGAVRFEFRAKSGKQVSVDFHDRRLARIIRACQDVPGQHLFQFLDDDGVRRAVDSTQVNDYLRDASGTDVTAKDFRTWGATVLAAGALARAGDYASETAAQRSVAEAVKQVARELGNTPAICRRCYVHPDVFECYFERALGDLQSGRRRRVGATLGLSAEERRVLAMLEAKARSRTGRGLAKALRESARAGGKPPRRTGSAAMAAQAP